MKRILCVVMAVLMVCSVFMMAGCEAKTVKFGMGVDAALGAQKDADGETNGSGEFNATAVAVLVDDGGKIVSIDLDTAQVKTAWTAEGTAVEAGEIKTKYEQGTDYGMAAYGKKHDGSEGQPKEWNEQADAFEAAVTGKTLDEVKAMIGSDGYPTDEDLVTAGCTINVFSFVTALEKAVANAAESEASAKDTVKVGTTISVSGKDASEEADGTAQADVTFVATAVNEKGTVTAAKTDAVQGKMTYNMTGAATAESATVKTKAELGTDYGMAAYGKKHDGSEGAPLEWNEQAAEFDAAIVGKTAGDFAALAGDDGYATGDLATAGCTINVGAMIKAAVKAAE